MLEALGHLFFGQPHVIAAIEVDRRRGQVHQPTNALLQTSLDHVFSDQHVALMKVLIAPPHPHRPRAMDHGLDV
ncbi:hypothetical protein D3C75_1361720 [compost metagenome]